MHYRPATTDDAPLLAQMNRDLIQDEGHRNNMTVAELQQRMHRWLGTREYEAILFETNSRPAGYALFRRDPDAIYLRHFFVQRNCRRQGLGRTAYHWLVANAWASQTRIRLDVLINNHAARGFWRSLGFHDYCLTMESEPPTRPNPNSL